MLDEQALRYLLTRQIWALRDRVPSTEYEEVTKSLAVTRDKTAYTVTWSRLGEQTVRDVPRETFDFYRKGDRPDAEGVVGDYERANLLAARTLALEMLGRAEQFHLFELAPRRVRQAEQIAFVWNAVLCGALALAGPAEIQVFAGLLLACLWVEYIPKLGKLLTACALVAVSIAGPPATGMALGAMYALAQFLDPNRFLRGMRSGIALVASVAGAVMLIRQLPDVDLNHILLAGALVVVVLPVTLFRWTIGSHFRTLPTLIGLTAPVLAIEGFAVAAVIVAGNAVLCLLARMWGWRAFSHPNAATFQGVSRVSRQ